LADCNEQASFGFDAVVDPAHAANPLEKFHFGERVRAYRTLTRYQIDVASGGTTVSSRAPKGTRKRYTCIDNYGAGASWWTTSNEVELEMAVKLGLPINRAPSHPPQWIPNPCHMNAAPATFLRWRREKFDNSSYRFAYVVGEVLVMDGRLHSTEYGSNQFVSERSIRALEVLLEPSERGSAILMLALPEDLMAA
jgi:hypothetical protein